MTKNFILIIVLFLLGCNKANDLQLSTTRNFGDIIPLKTSLSEIKSKYGKPDNILASKGDSDFTCFYYDESFGFTGRYDRVESVTYFVSPKESSCGFLAGSNFIFNGRPELAEKYQFVKYDDKFGVDNRGRRPIIRFKDDSGANIELEYNSISTTVPILCRITVY